MKVTLQPSGLVLNVESGERLLDAARRQGLSCPQSCRNGNCHICSALLVEGRVRQAGTSHEHGEVFACLAEPEQDCVLQWYGVLAPGELPQRRLTFQLLECAELGGDVWRVRLLAPAGKPPRYHAGQYLLVEDASGEQMAFSIASAPHQGRELELHILATEERPAELIGQMQRERLVRVQLPFGDTHLTELPDGPLLLLAAGTGMAQMQSLVEHCRALGFAYPIHLYWGARQAGDFYTLPYQAEWQKMDNLRLHQVVSDEDDWAGRSGFLHEAVSADFADLKGLHVYASGSPAMIYATLDALVEAGMDAAQMRADVFAYAPRD